MFSRTVVLSLFSLVGACSAGSFSEEPMQTEEDLRLCRANAPPLQDRPQGLTPLLGQNDIEVAAQLPYPPGNVAVDPAGRVFLSFFPDTNYGTVKVGVVENGKVLAFPNDGYQSKIHTVLGIRADAQSRLWLL